MNKMWMALGGAALTVGVVAQAPAQTDECTFDGDVYDLDEAGIAQLYDCIDETLAEAYAADGSEVGSVYREWQPTATGAFAPGVHGDRLLFTYANDIGYDLYVQYLSEDGFQMPVGSVLAKETFSLTGEGAPRVGPLFVMTKVEPGVADEFGGWVYSAVRANGRPMGISQSFCHDCHVAFESQDSMGYPAWDVRFETE